jgi:Abortive infection alpha
MEQDDIMSNPITEGAKATQEVAKATGKGIDLASKLGQWAARFVEGPLGEVSGIIHDKLKVMRWERGIKLMERCEAFLKERGLPAPTRQVPLKVVLPLIEAATLEDSDELLELWATLLVNAADANSGVNVTRRLISILQDFEPLEAKCLQMIAELPVDLDKGGIMTARLPDSVAIYSALKQSPPSPPMLPLGSGQPEVNVALWNLVRLGCLRPSNTWGGRYIDVVNMTVLGTELIKACSKPALGPQVAN